MTYTTDIGAELQWNRASASPGKISRTHYAFSKGVQAHHTGCNECPYLAGGEAARHWHAGWSLAADRAERFAAAMSEDRRRW